MFAKQGEAGLYASFLKGLTLMANFICLPFIFPQKDNFYPVMRLLLPQLERERIAYGIKEVWNFIFKRARPFLFCKRHIHHRKILKTIGKGAPRRNLIFERTRPFLFCKRHFHHRKILKTMGKGAPRRKGHGRYGISSLRGQCHFYFVNGTSTIGTS